MIKSNFKLALIQFDISWESSETNLSTIERVLTNSSDDVDLILLPEMFNTGFTMNPQTVATSMNGEVVQWMQYLAKTKKTVVAGSLVIAENSSFWNRFIAVYPSGELRWYDKRHLFRMGRENKTYSAGNKQIIININGWRCALFICYDLRFPVWSRSINDYDLALYVANWPVTRNNVWETLLKARAIENQCYVAGVNRVGKDGLGDYSGNSMIVDFKGEVLQSLNTGKEGSVEAEISLDLLNEFKKTFPVWMDTDSFTINNL